MSEIPGLALILAGIVLFCSLARYREYARLHCSFLFCRGGVPIPISYCRSFTRLVLVGISHGKVSEIAARLRF